MIAGIVASGKLAIAPPPGPVPGPVDIFYGDANQGFYGTVPQADLVTGNDLRLHLGLPGTVFATQPSWLKMASKGKILFVAMTSIMTLTWKQLYDVGAIYGDGTNGNYPPSTSSPRLQDARIVIDGNTYIVRLLTGMSSDPSSGPWGVADSAGSTTSEWNTIMYPLVTIPPTSHVAPRWNLYTQLQLGSSSTAVGRDTLTMTTVNAAGFPNRATRGNNGIGYTNWVGEAQYASSLGWRPCLELVPPEI